MRDRVCILALVALMLMQGTGICGDSNDEPVGTRSTSLIPDPEIRDLELDEARGRLYASDVSYYHVDGVAVISLDTLQEVKRLDIPDPAGLELSPSGETLAVASYGKVYFVNADTLEIDGYAELEPPYESIHVWDVAFDGDDRLYVTGAGLGYGFRVHVIDVPLRQHVGTVGESNEFDSHATLEIDSARRRLYVGGYSRTSAVWNISVDPAVAVNDTGHYDLPRGMQLSPDKTELYLRHGVTLDAMTLEQVNETPLVGNIALDFENGFVYYSNYRTVVRLTAEAFEEKGRFCLPWTALDGSYPLTWLVVSHERKLAFALTGHAGNVNTLEAVPLVSEITGLQPPDGWIWDELMWPIRCCLSGDVDPSDMNMWLDGQQVPFRFYEEERIMSYTAPVGLKDGIHQVLVEGVDRDGNTVRKEWSFGIDTLPPEIHIFNGEATVRLPEYILEGQIVDLLFESADIQGEELLVGPDGTFQHRLDLDEGGNIILIRAADSEYRTNSSSTSILYVPPTMRYLSFDGSFSIEYPTSWSYEENYSVGGMSVHVVFLAAVGEGFTSNLNVIHAGELEEYSESHLMDLSNEALDQHSGLPWFHLFEGPTYLEIGGLPSVTFSFSWEANDSSVYQTQYIIADPEYQTSWVLTCTSEYGKYRKYDPLLRWMAETFRVEGAPPEDGDSVDQREDFHLWPVVLAFGLGSLAAALVAVLLFQRSRRKRRMKEPQPPRKKEILGEDDTL